MRQFAYSVVVIAVGVFGGVTAQAQQDGLSGEVKGQDGNPKPSVHVYFDGPQAYFALTNKDGAFSIPQFRAGAYTVRVQRGHNAQSFFRKLESGSELRLTVNW